MLGKLGWASFAGESWAEQPGSQAVGPGRAADSLRPLYIYIYIYIHIYIYIYLSISLSLYIYIYIEREREGESSILNGACPEEPSSKRAKIGGGEAADGVDSYPRARCCSEHLGRDLVVVSLARAGAWPDPENVDVRAARISVL